MHNDSLRNHLRLATSALHHQLDTSLGEFTTKSAYSNYVQKTHCFRLAVEQVLSCANKTGWQLDPISELAAHDLQDLEMGQMPHKPVPVRASSSAAHLGALYVIEGSALGARLLYRRAQDLGMTEAFGARHLAHQSADSRRWRSFLEILETVPAEEHDIAAEAAIEIFRFALSVYREPVHECA